MSDNLNEEQAILDEIAEEEIKEETPIQNLEHDSVQKTFEGNNQKTESKPTDDLLQIQSTIQTIEQKAKEDVGKIQQLLKLGLINSLQGQSLIQLVMKKGYDQLQQCGLKENDSIAPDKSEGSYDKRQAITEFEKENPGFFNDEGRLDVLNYIKSGSLEFDKDELSQISKMIEIVENAAIQRYLKKSEFESQMQKTNEAAKSRLAANAQSSKETPSKQLTFTREQIGNMSGAEFTKNEKLIMDQLRKGLIR